MKAKVTDERSSWCDTIREISETRTIGGITYYNLSDEYGLWFNQYEVELINE